MAFKSTVLFCLAAAAASVTTYAATDSSFGMQDSSTVSVRNVNFSRPDEVAALYRRIAYAADRVCGPRNMQGFHFESRKYTACYNNAVDAAVASVDRPELSAYQDRLAHGSHQLASRQ